MSENHFTFQRIITYYMYEQFDQGRRKARRVFERSRVESASILVTLGNGQAGAENWIGDVTFKIVRIAEELEVIGSNTIRKLVGHDMPSVDFEMPLFPVSEELPTHGPYAVLVSVEEQTLVTHTFFVSNLGNVTINHNPYFSVNDVKVYNEEKTSTIGISKRSVSQFALSETGQVDVEVYLKNKIYEGSWFCELFVSCYTEEGELKEQQSVLQVIRDTDTDFTVSCRLGTGEENFWRPGTYRILVSFMETVVAECYISFGETEEQGGIHLETDPHVITKRGEIEKARKKPNAFTRIPLLSENPVFPATLDDKSAIRIAYHEDLERITGYIRNGLSVLIICDKVITELIYKEVCWRANKTAILDNFNFDVKDFINRMHRLVDGEILILRSLEVLSDALVGSSILFQPDKTGNLPQIMAFCDASTPIKPVLRRRFALPERVQGIPREIEINGVMRNPLPYLITSDEKALFNDFNEHELYKQVAGLNILQFRHAFKYIQSVFKESASSQSIYQTLRVFKQHSNSNDIDLPTVSFADIGGYEDVKQQIQISLSLFQQDEENLSKEQQQDTVPKGFIFHGPPGTGKTMFAKAIANKLNATIQMISGPEIIEMWVGKSEENLREVFATARRNAPSVILFDEFDSIARKRTNVNTGGAMVANSLMAQLLTELDGFRPIDGVLVIATTNRIQDIDPALMRPSRLRRVLISLPDLDARKKVASLHAQHYKIDKIVAITLEICMKHFKAWQESAEDGQERQISDTFFSEITATFPSIAMRLKNESAQLELRSEIAGFLTFLQGLEQKGGMEPRDTTLVKAIAGRFESMKSKIQPAGTAVPDLQFSPKTVLEREFEEIYTLLQGEVSENPAFITKDYMTFLIDLIAEFTEGCNNDQIGSLFKEALIAHSLEGRLLTPRYFGEQIGVIKAMKEP
ncbi:ATP-binding protein [Flavitalea sp. BT771]|uniref:ATP-binding protein n=1 Tax=Flavitalea sp. BT771 TaxID=3063329 RepID=UPI0026E19DCA|nr:ATP-binding protein [Flavitalea sp. BT771]MDO6433085.1 ATP-binding protein [Flavitalea sp. BT771]MDV6221639.1 ATP-binding protein [Flavitalea sp. BT771]